MEPASLTLDQKLEFLFDALTKQDSNMQQLMGVVQASQTEVAMLRASHATMQATQPAQPEALGMSSAPLPDGRTLVAEALARSHSRLPSVLKVQALRTFSGVRSKSEDLAAWLFSAEQMFRLADVHDDELRINYAGQALTDHAATWFYSRRRDGALNRLETWDAFKAGLRSQFQGANAAEQAKDQLLKLVQGKDTLQQYTDRFLQLHTIVGDVPESDLVFYYKRGLKPALQRDVARSDIKTFSDMLELVERIENIYVQIQGDWKPARPSRDAPDSAASHTGQAPMDLGAMQPERQPRRPERDRLQNEEQKRRMAQNLCYGCGKAGHIRKECKTHPWRSKQEPGNGSQPAQGGR